MTSPLYWARGFSAQAQTLQALSPEALCHKIQQGEDGLAAQIKLLRTLVRTDPAAYQQRKRFLPYFMASHFLAGIRKIDHLKAAYGWVLDLDQAYESEAQFSALKERLWRDPRVWLLYVSPSGRGLKLLFRFAEPLTGSKPFSDAYQAFARQWARQYDLASWVDYKTHDATRVSFLSHDPDLRYRPEPLLLHPLSYLRLGESPPSLIAPDLLTGAQDPAADPANPEPPAPTLPEATPEDPAPEDSPGPDPSEEVWAQIKQTLGDPRPPRPRQVSLPPEIEALTPQIVAAAQDMGLTLKDTLDLNYGRKFVFGYQHLWAEVNVYHGKHGYSVVKSPKSGSHPGLRDLAHDLIHRLIFDPEGLDELSPDAPDGPPPWI